MSSSIQNRRTYEATRRYFTSSAEADYKDFDRIADAEEWIEKKAREYMKIHNVTFVKALEYFQLTITYDKEL